MSFRWVLAQGRDEDKEVEQPGIDEEIVIFKVEQQLDSVDPDGDLVTITFAHAGADDLLGWELVEAAAVRLYSKFGNTSSIPWAFLPLASQRFYVQRAQCVLAGVTEYRRDHRGEPE